MLRLQRFLAIVNAGSERRDELPHPQRAWAVAKLEKLLSFEPQQVIRVGLVERGVGVLLGKLIDVGRWV